MTTNQIYESIEPTRPWQASVKDRFITGMIFVVSVLASGIISTSYEATSLIAGVTYQFKVESRNSYGYSDYSTIITMLCAYIPEPPTSVTTSNSAD